MTGGLKQGALQVDVMDVLGSGGVLWMIAFEHDGNRPHVGEGMDLGVVMAFWHLALVF